LNTNPLNPSISQIIDSKNIVDGMMKQK